MKRVFEFDLNSVLDFSKISDSEYLESKKISKKDYILPSPTAEEHIRTIYNVYNYDKNFLTHDKRETTGLFRSVIMREDEIVAFAPPKSVRYDSFIQRHKDTGDLIIEEFVEGTMINLFYNVKKVEDDIVIGEWELATRTTVGGKSVFFKETTKDNEEKSVSFRKMFLEAMNESGLEFTMFDPRYCYSFVVQHPKNRIVSVIDKPTIYLIAIYQIDNETKKVYEVVLDHETNKIYHHVKQPLVIEAENYDEVKEKYASMNTDYSIMGVVFKSRDGLRSKLRNPNYEQVKHLRGNSPKLQYQYLSLRQMGKVKEFLKYYPEYRKDLQQFRDDLHNYTNKLHENYIACYIQKQKPLGEFPKKFRSHMFKLHEKYLSELREQKGYINKKTVIEYMNSLHPAQQMFVLNYNLRTQNLDEIKKETDSKIKNLEN